MEPNENVELPELEPVVAPLTAEEKQARQRLHVRRTYYRKLHRLQTLRTEVQQLEAQYQQLVDRNKLMEACAFVADLPEFLDEKEYQKHLRLREYQEVSGLQTRLQQQNEALQAAVADYDQYVEYVKTLVDTEQGWSKYSSSSSDETESPETRLSSVLNQSPVVIPTLRAPLTVEYCRQVALQRYEEIRRIRESPDALSTGASVFGWRDKRHHDKDLVNFYLTKTFPDISVEQLMVRGWNYLSAPRHMASLYSASITPQIFMVQRVDADTVVLMRVFSSADGNSLIRSFYLASRLRIPTGYCVIYRSLDNSLLAPYQNPPGIQDRWVNYNTWVTMEHVGERGQSCALSFGGEVHHALAAMSHAWMIEVLYIVMRWESLVVGSRVVIENGGTS
ncbi:hypothetical protein Poli38472_006539 [Pythium oligandrum]|uniref:Uncharacterized protein n=1 Tax=Pythium oligandrum TaxID=41045 RepID=A0A8K1C4S0_PYTOL|nr:hypothetical protein Poli38472_006539 [Pythium oligandrum]|eukprot:TMW56529.1 hypothetical protein Poli38472_006539 [Pythium oligandrum]